MELVFSANSAHETKKNNLLHHQALILPSLFFYLLTLGQTTFHILVECRTSELVFYHRILFISVAEHWSVQNGGLWFESWQGNKKFFFVRYSSKTLKLSFARYLPTTWCRCNCMWLQIMVIITHDEPDVLSNRKKSFGSCWDRGVLLHDLSLTSSSLQHSIVTISLLLIIYVTLKVRTFARACYNPETRVCVYN